MVSFKVTGFEASESGALGWEMTLRRACVGLSAEESGRARRGWG